MNKELQEFARRKIKQGLLQCNSRQQSLFRRMYSHGGPDISMDSIVDNLADEKLEWAMEQVRRTLKKARDR